MSTSYSIDSITPKTMDRAYPLMRAVAPALTIEEWREFCRDNAASSPDGTRMSEKEEIILAINPTGYVKGLCIYSIRDHRIYGRLLDVPIFFAASAADAEGVAAKLLRHLQAICHRSVCSGVRFWTMGSESWNRRRDHKDIRRTDHGIFMPAVASAAQIENALSACTLAGGRVIGRLSR